MKREYDFSHAEKGKFYRKGALLRLPIYLEPKVQRNLEKIAHRKHRPMTEMVNELVRKEMEMIGHFL